MHTPENSLFLPCCRRCVHLVGGALLEVEVGTREEWKDPKHPLKCVEAYTMK